MIARNRRIDSSTPFEPSLLVDSPLTLTRVDDLCTTPSTRQRSIV